MSTAALVTAASAPSAARTVRRLVVRQVRHGTLIVAVVAAGMSALVAAQYQSTFSGQLDQGALHALAANPAVRVLFGPPVALDDPGGFTVWRTGTPVLVIAAVWILLAVVRITRGEEDAGRWDLLLAGPLRTVDAVARCLLAVIGAAVVIGVAVGLSMVAAGTDPRGAAFYAAGVLGTTAWFATVGTLAAQAMPTRSAAVGVSVAVLGAALLLRMLSDGVAVLAWTAWLTPFGLLGRVGPYAHNDVAPLVVLAAVPPLIGVAALATARRRDVGSGVLTVSTRRRPRTFLLRSVGGFALRRALRPGLGWSIGIGAYFLLLGAMLTSILQFLTENPRFAELAATGGFAGLSSADGFAAALFSLLAIATGMYAATRLAALVTDEKGHRWTTTLAAPVSRARIVGQEIAVTAAGVLVLHTVAALAMWVGSASTGGPLRLDAALASALNPAPVALVALGAAALAVGWLPSAVAAMGAVPVVGGFLLDVLADSLRAPRWLQQVSPFPHVASVPAEPPNAGAIVAFLVIGAALAASGVAGYRRRDLVS
ncbi:ABC transporter permease [Mycolicibacterium baixiangningiae]|uniref:ABC transporter permease n=1 Tax=Mycolicibacterium baixiangningiae TaxID=2761578 RepID=UPI0018D16801|nr:polyketide antibiotic transporter [Mycolicibacterium baixiangningiae]